VRERAPNLPLPPAHFPSHPHTLSYPGNFSGPKEHEIVVARGSFLELLKPDEGGRLQTILSVDTFSIIRSLVTYRLIGQTADYLVVGSDSGRLAVLEYKKEANAFKKLHVETFGKTGARRITPGQFVAREPNGRAIMIAATEKQKLVYVMNRDNAGALTISSPLEAHRPGCILFDVVGLDNGFNNPLFACLELDYTEADSDASGEAVASATKMLTYYELDLGVNTMVRKWSRETDRGANALIAVPGDADGPGGTLVLAENWVLYEHNSGQAAIRTPIPRRTDMPDDKGLLLVAQTVFKSKAGFFALVQSELGDLYRVTLELDASKKVTELRVKYFDTLPVASSISITRNGMLFVASESGNQLLYTIASLGETDGAAQGAAEALSLKVEGAAGAAVEVACPVFIPRPLTNLAKADEVASLAPITDMTVLVPSDATAAAIAQGAPVVGAVAVSLSVHQLVAACGRGPRSSLRLLQQGTHVAEIGRSSLPGAPLAVFTLKGPESASAGTATSADRYVLLSFSNATVVMAVGDSLEEVSARDIGFVDDAPTLAACVLADGSFLQVTPLGMRMVPFSATGVKGAQRNWQPPGRRTVVRAAVNMRQILLALSGGELIYFEYDNATRLPKEVKKRSLGAEVCALTLPPVPEGRLRSPFAALGDSNNMARIISLDPERCLEQASAQALRASAESLALLSVRMPGSAGPLPHLFIGLSNGVLTRLAMDGSSGMLSDPRVRFLGARPVRLIPVAVGGTPGLLALSQRAHVGYSAHGTFQLQPLCYDTVDAAAPFCTDALPEAFIGIAGASLRIFGLDALGQPFFARSLPLDHTPRKLAVHYPSGLAVIAESEHNALTSMERAKAAAEAAMANPEETLAGGRSVPKAEGHAESDDMDTEAEAEEEGNAGGAGNGGDVRSGDPHADGVDSRRTGRSVPGEEGKWASCLRLVDLLALSSEGAVVDRHAPPIHSMLELEDNEAAFSVACVAFHDQEPPALGGPASGAASFGLALGEQVVLVGCARGVRLRPLSAQSASVHAYRVLATVVARDGAGQVLPAGSVAPADGSTSVRYSLQLLHKTPLPAIPFAIASFMGRALIGVGRNLGLYDLGRKQLLRKCEARGLPTLVRTLSTSLDRIFVGDAQESIHFVKYKRAENVLVVFADDTQPRHVTCSTVLDHDTVAVGDRFGSIALLRLPASVSDEIDAVGPTGSRMLWDSGLLGGAPSKAVPVALFYVGGAVTSISKTVLTSGGAEVLLYTTAAGAIGALLPLTSKDDADFFTHLELFLRAEESGQGLSLTGREHTSYRSYYGPVSVSCRPQPRAPTRARLPSPPPTHPPLRST
jgi:splicing factor 3B subunit 3